MISRFVKKAMLGLTLSTSVVVCGIATAQQQEVVVVGAGMAGLTAAYELEQRGYSVTVLEARDRIGGRIGSLDMGGQHGETGGELIDHPRVHTEVNNYADEFDVEMASTGYWGKIEEGAYYIEGQLIPYGSLKRELGLQVRQDYNRFNNELDALGDLIHESGDPRLSENAAELDNTTVQEWIDGLNLHPIAKELGEHYIRAEFDDAENVSLLYMARQYAFYQSVGDNESEILRFLDGGRAFAEAFEDRLAQPVLLNHAVTAIKQNGNGVVVTAAGKKFSADYAVVTVPSTVLNRIAFTPALSDWKQEAADNLNYGSHTKVLMQYSKRFWLDYGLGGDTLSDTQIGWTWESTESQEGEGGILIAYSSGSYTDQQIDWSEQDIINNRLEQIEEMYPNSSQYFVDAKLYAYHREEWTMGGFAAYSPGQVMKYWGAFIEPDGRVYFAGEHTDDDHVGFIEGAVRSGQRAVKQIAGE
ncbi:L-amino acid dehydrogenase [Sinobacterium norvegicum]|uniref:L-amino acid dehydrogenase n=1 Tax=Sinobacterium norvegicum TaxID=1641715 RepID=A0ABN8EHV0_9GAMM|nr:flavin monoamine oxidase family protein [Sinobacterium norvegicum]CAH0991193.1 L-amino acid dehydrogenase [Sinobacterium norvegicum]